MVRRRAYGPVILPPGLFDPGPELFAGTLKLTTRTITDERIDPDDAQAGFRLGADGKLYRFRSLTGFTALTTDEWIEPESSMSLFEMRWVLTAGDTVAVGSVSQSDWHTMDANRDVKASLRTTVGDWTSVCTVDIREIADTGNAVQAVITIESLVST